MHGVNKGLADTMCRDQEGCDTTNLHLMMPTALSWGSKKEEEEGGKYSVGQRVQGKEGGVPIPNMLRVDFDTARDYIIQCELPQREEYARLMQFWDSAHYERLLFCTHG